MCPSEDFPAAPQPELSHAGIDTTEPLIIADDGPVAITGRFVKYTVGQELFSLEELAEHLDNLEVPLPTATRQRNSVLRGWLNEVEATELERGERVRLVAVKIGKQTLFAMAELITESSLKEKRAASAPTPVEPSIMPPEIIPVKATPMSPEPKASAPVKVRADKLPAAPEILVIPAAEQIEAWDILTVFLNEPQIEVSKTPRQILNELAAIDPSKNYTVDTIKRMCRKMTKLNLIDQAQMVRNKHYYRVTMANKAYVKEMLETPEGREQIWLHMEVGEPLDEPLSP